jgi:hypothetical protein
MGCSAARPSILTCIAIELDHAVNGAADNQTDAQSVRHTTICTCNRVVDVAPPPHAAKSRAQRPTQLCSAHFFRPLVFTAFIFSTRLATTRAVLGATYCSCVCARHIAAWCSSSSALCVYAPRISAQPPCRRTMHRHASTSRVFLLSTLMLLLCIVSSSIDVVVGLQWDRPLPVPSGLTQHTSVAMNLSTIELASTTVSQFHPQNFTLQGSVIVVYGGLRIKNDISGELWMTLWPPSLNRGGGIQWARPPIFNAKPQPRYGHTALSLDGFIDSTMLIFAGAGSTSVFSSMWAYRLTSNTFVPMGPACPDSFTNRIAPYSVDSCPTGRALDHQVDNAGCPWPAPRVSHTLTRLKDTLYLFGGSRQQSALESDALGELWSLKIDVEAWMDLLQVQAASGSSMWLFPEPWQSMLPCAIAWVQLTQPDGSARLRNSSSGRPFPGARYNHAATTFRGKLYIIGGSLTLDPDTGQYDDAWSYDPALNEWNELNFQPVPYGWESRPTARSFGHLIGLESVAPEFLGGGLVLLGGGQIGKSVSNLAWILMPPNTSSSHVVANATHWTFDIIAFNVKIPNFYVLAGSGGSSTFLPELNQLVLIGGQSGQSFMTTVFSFNFSSLLTVSLPPHLPLPTAGAAGSSCIPYGGPSPRFRHGQVLIDGYMSGRRHDTEGRETQRTMKASDDVDGRPLIQSMSSCVSLVRTVCSSLLSPCFCIPSLLSAMSSVAKVITLRYRWTCFG